MLEATLLIGALIASTLLIFGAAIGMGLWMTRKPRPRPREQARRR